MYELGHITAAGTEEIPRRRCPEPHATYDGGPASVAGLLDPRYDYRAVFGPGGGPDGYFCFGVGATEPAGRRLGPYADDAPDAGVGLDFLRASLRFARPSPPSTTGP